MPKVTAVVTCFNQGATIRATLDSVRRQTYEDVSTIVVDDGSTDAQTLATLDTLSDPSTKVIRVSNGKVSRARNIGIDAADSEYILVLDSDDLFASSFLAEAVRRLEGTMDIGIVSCWVETCGLSRWQVKPEGGDVLNFLHKNNCPGQALMRRKCWEEAGGYREGMTQGYEDWDFYISVTKIGWRVDIIDRFLLSYYISASSSNTGGYRIRPQLVREIVANHRELFQQNIEYVVAQKEQALLERNDEIRALIFDGPGDRFERPQVSFGDGGMAFAVQVELERRARRSHTAT